MGCGCTRPLTKQAEIGSHGQRLNRSQRPAHTLGLWLVIHSLTGYIFNTII